MKYKTHRAVELDVAHDGEEVRIAGWVKELRDLGHIKFVLLRDSTGEVQVTWKSEDPYAELGGIIGSLRQNDVIAISGEIRKSSISRRGLEVSPRQITILSRAKHPMPLDVTGAIDAGLDVRLDFRPIDLMRPQANRIFRLYSEALRIIREFFLQEGFVEVVTPKLISTATEGGANLFSLDYFDRKAFLAQSPQLYKEQLTIGLERVFEIATYFRAEPFDTTKHLNEFLSIDIEAAFADYNDVMELLERMVSRLIEDISRNDVLDTILEKDWRDLRIPIPRYTYDDLFNKMHRKDIPVKYGEDLSSEHLKKMDELKGPYFITDWPRAAKPFYIKAREGSDLTESFDFMYEALEVCSGGGREQDLKGLKTRMIESGLKTEGFQEHLKFFEFGMPPHAGWGLGFNRLLMALTGLQNIREVVLYPRDKFRLAP